MSYFISNYNELRFHYKNIIEDTEKFLKNIYTDAFTRKGIALPYFLKSSLADSPYSLYNNLLKNKALLFEEKIGINKKTIIKMCSQIGISFKSEHNYDTYVREFLIKVKVGH